MNHIKKHFWFYFNISIGLLFCYLDSYHDITYGPQQLTLMFMFGYMIGESNKDKYEKIY